MPIARLRQKSYYAKPVLQAKADQYNMKRDSAGGVHLVWGNSPVEAWGVVVGLLSWD